MKFYVYFLIDPRTDSVFYVGKGRYDGKRPKRPSSHIDEFLEWDKLGRFSKPHPGWNLHKIRKIAQIIDAGLEVKIEIAFETESEYEAFLQECNCIAAFGRENLTNLTDGGEGPSGYRHSEEWKKKRSVRFTGEGNPFFGKSHSEETKKRISESESEKVISDEHREAIRKANTGNKHLLGHIHTEETRKKMSRSAINRETRVFSDQARENIRKSRLGKTLSKDTKKKIGERTKGVKKSEETRIRMSYAAKLRSKLKSNPKGALIFARLEGLTEEQLKDPRLAVFARGFKNGYPGLLISHNEITPGFSTLIGRLCLQNDEPAGGLTYCGVGTGNVGWDPLNPPAATGNETDMENEFFRKSWASANFVDSNGTPRTVNEAISLGLNTVDFEVTFSEGEAVGTITEIGIWGGDATATLGSGTLCDYETLAGIPKPANASLTFVFRWEF